MQTIDYIIKIIETLVNIPSPSGFTKEVIAFVKSEAEGFGYSCETSQKGGLIISVESKGAETISVFILILNIRRKDLSNQDIWTIKHLLQSYSEC